jgi:diguanylate cyclase (GGDEF)-like protein
MTWQAHGEDVRLLLPEPLLERAERMLAERGAEAAHLCDYVMESRNALNRDDRTTLPNRRGLLRAMDEVLRQRSPDQAVAVMALDIAGLGAVNQSFGHTSGDELVAGVGRRLRRVAPPAAQVSRLGGGEFAVILLLPDADAAVKLAAELHQALREPMSLGSFILDVDTAVGIAMHPDHGSDPETPGSTGRCSDPRGQRRFRGRAAIRA